MITLDRRRAGTVDRFRSAQDHKGTYTRALREIQAGRKRTHWMWFVFPQLAALAKSDTARYYGITDKAEALAYLDDAVLRARLAECTMGILSHRKLMLSRPDDHKLRSCMTLFREVVEDATLPNAVLDKFFDGKPDQLTLDVLAGRPITLPVGRPSAMGRVEWKQASAWDEYMAAADAQEPDRPMDRAEVARYVRGFNLPPAAVKQLVAKWMEDQDRARDAGWNSHADSAWYDQH